MLSAIYKLFTPEGWTVLTCIGVAAASNWACACYFKLREINKKLDDATERTDNKA
jgi:hypothetical protein